MEEKEIDIFEKIQAQLEALHNEISTLSKKSQNDALNTFKLKFVNQILIEAKSILGEMYIPFSEFTVFDANDIPTNSDVAFVISQYLGCMEKMRIDNINPVSEFVNRKYISKWVWKGTRKQTHAPSKIKEF